MERRRRIRKKLAKIWVQNKHRSKSGDAGENQPAQMSFMGGRSSVVLSRTYVSYEGCVMRYSVSIDINLPRDRVVELFDNPEHMASWQPCLVSCDYLEGEPGQVGTKSKLVHKMGKREMEMLETVTHRDLPNLFTHTFEAKGVWNEVVNRFKEQPGGGSTVWEIETEFRCQGMMWLMCNLAPFMFKKETRKNMQQFKTFAEGLGQGT